MGFVPSYNTDWISEQDLRNFMAESNRIEGIDGYTSDEINVLRSFMEIPTSSGISVPDVENLASVFVNRRHGDPRQMLLRARGGMDVKIRNAWGIDYYPPKGGWVVVEKLTGLLDAISNLTMTPFDAHRAYEWLHPFIDGNGRTGRAVWAWHMAAVQLDPFELPFLHRYYYQSLENYREGV